MCKRGRGFDTVSDVSASGSIVRVLTVEQNRFAADNRPSDPAPHQPV